MDHSGSAASGVGWMIALFAISRALAVGVEANDTVAIQCIVGRSLEKYFVFNGPINSGARYRGMQRGFCANREIMRSTQSSYDTPHMRKLSVPEYNDLLECTQRRFDARFLESTHGLHVVPWAPVNRLLDIDNALFPIWRWGLNKFGLFGIFRHAVGSAPALLPLPVILLARVISGYSILPELLYAIIFAAISIYGSYLLEIRREVSYIKVLETDVSPKLRPLWTKTYNRAKLIPAKRPDQRIPDSPTGIFKLLPLVGFAVKPSATEVLDEIVAGEVRKDSRSLLIPVLSFTPAIEDPGAEKVFAFTHLRALLLSLVYFMSADIHVWWLIAYGVAAYVEASLQNIYAKDFLKEAKPYEVNWFRRYPDLTYPAELPEYRVKLDVG
jgi:hypothetical protein